MSDVLHNQYHYSPAFSKRVEIHVDAEEVVDRIEEMLSWLSVASQAGLTYEVSHFFRARPYILLVDGVVGELTPSSVVVYDDHGVDYNQTLSQYESGLEQRRSLPALLEKPRYRNVRYAELVEHDPRDPNDSVNIGRLSRKNCTGDLLNTNKFIEFLESSGHNNLGLTVDADDNLYRASGTNIDIDAAADDFLKSDYCVLSRLFKDTQSWGRVKYSLNSIGESTPLVSRARAAKYKLPQTARTFLCQGVVMFEDGQVIANQEEFALWSGKFFDMRRRPISVDDRINFLLCSALAEADVRQQSWEVELSFGRRRTGVSLSTDAVGARMFTNMLRREHTGAGRRRALVHWVREHMRRRRADDVEASVLVNAHLRGQATVDMGLRHARIWPSKNAVDSARNGSKYVHG